MEKLIEEKAYEVYQRRVRSGVPGDQHSDWVQAEKEVHEELKKADAGKSKGLEAKSVAPAVAHKAEVKPVAAAPKVEAKPVVPAPKVEVKPVVPAAVHTHKAEVKEAEASPVKKVVAKKAASVKR